MSKLTRKRKAELLLQALERGPSIAPYIQGAPTADEIEERVRLWLGTWIIPSVVELVPELRVQK